MLLAGCAGGRDTSADVSGAHGTHRPGSAGWHGTPITKGYPLPDQEFTDTAGDTVVPAEDVDSPVTLVFFGYTHCPDICNVVLANIASALRGATPEVRSATTLLFVTTDPARDTPEAVREYLDRFDPTYRGLVAPVETVASGRQGPARLLRAPRRLDGRTTRSTTARTRRPSSTGRPASSGPPTPRSPTSAPTSTRLARLA